MPATLPAGRVIRSWRRGVSSPMAMAEETRTQPPGVPPNAGLVLVGLTLCVASLMVAVAIALYRPGDGASSAPKAVVPDLSPRAAGGVPLVRTSTPGFPAPPRGAVVYGREDGKDALALAVLPGRKLVLHASVVGPEGKGVSSLGVRFRVRFGVADATVPGRACGAGCYS